MKHMSFWTGAKVRRKKLFSKNMMNYRFGMLRQRTIFATNHQKTLFFCRKTDKKNGFK